MEGLPLGAVSRLENGRALGPWGFDSLSFRFGGMASWYGSALLRRGRVARLAGSNPAASVFRRGRVGKTRGCYPRERRFEPCRRSSKQAPVVEGDDAGFSLRKLRVRVPPGVFQLVVGEQAPRQFRELETAGSIPAGQIAR
jgi:hypothetical protein